MFKVANAALFAAQPEESVGAIHSRRSDGGLGGGAVHRPPAQRCRRRSLV